MMQLRVDGLAEDPLDAAARFHADVPTAVATMLGISLPADDPSLTLIFAPADHTHRAWRVAAVQSLARRHAPARINALAASDDDAIAAALRYLAAAPGVTGQYLPLDGTGASELLS